MIRTGVGKSLMEACMDIAIEMKKNNIWLGVWEQNQRAIDFYNARGLKSSETMYSCWEMTHKPIG